MGNWAARALAEPDMRVPDQDEAPSFDPMLGFPNGRVERVMIATEEEMIAAKLEPKERDYCAHLLLNLLSCRADTFPWPLQCGDEKHALEECEYQDYVMRMKEWEREKRLREWHRAQKAVKQS